MVKPISLLPTTPFRTSDDIDIALKLLFESNADSVVSVTNVGGMHPLRMKKIINDTKLVNYVNQNIENMRPRQELPPVYIRNGAIYTSKCSILHEYHSLVGPDCRAHKMPADRSINIDTIIDFKLAELVLSE